MLGWTDILLPCRSYLRVCRDEVMALTVQGKPAMECYQIVLSRLLQVDASEGCGTAVAPLALQLILRYVSAMGFYPFVLLLL